MTLRNPVDVSSRDPSLVAKNQALGPLTENGEPAWTTPSSTDADPRNPKVPHTPGEIGRIGRLVAAGPSGVNAERNAPVSAGTVARSEGFDTPPTVLSRPRAVCRPRSLGLALSWCTPP